MPLPGAQVWIVQPNLAEWTHIDSPEIFYAQDLNKLTARLGHSLLFGDIILRLLAADRERRISSSATFSATAESSVLFSWREIL